MRPPIEEIEKRAMSCAGKKFTVITADGDGEILAEFLSHLMEDIPALLAYCKELEAKLEAKRDRSPLDVVADYLEGK